VVLSGQNCARHVGGGNMMGGGSWPGRAWGVVWLRVAGLKAKVKSALGLAVEQGLPRGSSLQCRVWAFPPGIHLRSQS